MVRVVLAALQTSIWLAPPVPTRRVTEGLALACCGMFAAGRPPQSLLFEASIPEAPSCQPAMIGSIQ